MRRTLCFKRSRIVTQKIVKILSELLLFSPTGPRLREDGLVVPGKYIAKGPKKRLEVLKNELDKRAIKLNYMKLDISVIMQKNILKNL